LPTPISISTGAFRPKIAKKSTTPAPALSPGRKIFGGGTLPRLRGPVRGGRGGITAPDRLSARRMEGRLTSHHQRPRDHENPDADVAGDASLAREPDARAELVRDLVLLDRG
jgi:hypothetical protein